jgi:hypothetical protein
MSEENPPVPFLQGVPWEPTLADLLDLKKREVFLDLNCHAVGTIRTFDATKLTAQVTINYKKTNFTDDENGVRVPQYLDYPILIDCPVVVLQGGDGALTFPIAPNDECLVLFNDRCIDTWFSSGQVVPLPSFQLHSMSDGIVLVGLRNAKRPLPQAYDADRTVLRKGTTLVALGESKIEVANATLNLNTLLQNLATQLQTLTTQLGIMTVVCATPGNPSGVPVNAAALIAVGTQIGTIATQIGELLE